MEVENIEEEVGLEPANTFITANTIGSSLEDIRNNHIIPVFTKFNEPLISHSDFVGAALEAVVECYPREVILEPVVRLSHPVKGRVPEAKNKPAKDLLESEKTLFYERMAFMIEIPTISDIVGSNGLNLTIGGVKAYNMDNYNSNRKDQHFIVFVGLKNMVCTNLCVRTDGLKADIVVRNLWDLRRQIRELIADYNAVEHFKILQPLVQHELHELQVAHFIGRLKMAPHLSNSERKRLPELKLTDGQVNYLAEAYYKDPHFGCSSDGKLSLWSLYNNLTGAIKSSYIDQYVPRLAMAHRFIEGIPAFMEGKNDSYDWYLKT